jgi:hypothetical protein
MSDLQAFLKKSGIFAASAIAAISLSSCETAVSQDYEATATTTYTWQVAYRDEGAEDRRPPRIEQFASTSLVNVNGQRPDGAVTGPDDQGLYWPDLPPRPTVDQLESRQQQGEAIGTPELNKSVEYFVQFYDDGQRRRLPTNYSVYRQVVRAYPNQTPLEFILGVNEGSVEQARPQ